MVDILRMLRTVVFFAAALAISRADAGVMIYVANSGNDTVGTYDGVTGATLNSTFINGQGLNAPVGLALDANNHIFVSSISGNTIGSYDATTGATVNASFITGLSFPEQMAFDGTNLFVTNYTNSPGNGYVGQYNATNGAAVNANFIPNGQGLDLPVGILLDGNNHLLVSNRNNDTIGQYDATTGATVNSTFVNGQGLNGPYGIVLGGNRLYVANFDNGTIGVYNATNGATINSNLISGLGGPVALALDGNHLYVSNWAISTIGEYDAISGNPINASLITAAQGLSNPYGMVLVGSASAVPEPSTFLLVAMGLPAVLARRRAQKNSPAIAEPSAN
jgi:hypothetical protein